MFTATTLPGAAYPLFKTIDHHQCRRLNFSANFKTHAAVKKRRSSHYPSDDDEGEQTQQHVTRRVIMQSVLLAALGTQADSLNTADSKTVINSILGAYGLPTIAATKGYRQYDDFDEEYTFIYPSSWVKRKNTLREGVYIADFKTADKLSVESFPLPDNGMHSNTSSNTSISESNKDIFAQLVVEKLLNPGKEVGGDSRLETPRSGLIKSEIKEKEGVTYVYIVYPSSTTTRSGYDVKRKNAAVAAVKRGVVYALGASARSDQYGKEKTEVFNTIVDSFRIRKSSFSSYSTAET
jgi:hypothetical protein